MDKFKIDYDELMKELVPNPNMMPLSGNEHRLVRVAFDLFRLKDGDPEDLWQVQSNDDGEFLVRTFSVPDEEKITTSSDWSVEIDRKEANLTVAYKHIPLTRLAAKSYGAVTPEDAQLLKRVVYKKLVTDAEFGKRLIASLPIEKQMALKEAEYDSDSCEKCGESNEICSGHKCEKCGRDECNCPEALSDDSEWRLAFLDLKIHKNSGLFEEEQEEYERMLGGTEAEEEWLESENKLTEALEDQDVNAKEAIEKAYYMIEHDLKPGSEDAAKLSELAWEVESGKKDYTELEELMSEFETAYAEDNPEDYSDYFMMKCKEHGVDPNDIPGLSGEARQDLFKDIDAGWAAQNECIGSLTQRRMKKTDLLISKRADESKRRESLYSKLQDPTLMMELHGMVDKLEEMLPSIDTSSPRSKFIYDLINEARKNLGQVEGWVEDLQMKEKP